MEPVSDRELGETAVRNRLLTREELEGCLQAQRLRPRPLEVVLHDLQYLTLIQIDAIATQIRQARSMLASAPAAPAQRSTERAPTPRPVPAPAARALEPAFATTSAVAATAARTETPPPRVARVGPAPGIEPAPLVAETPEAKAATPEPARVPVPVATAVVAPAPEPPAPAPPAPQPPPPAAAQAAPAPTQPVEAAPPAPAPLFPAVDPMSVTPIIPVTAVADPAPTALNGLNPSTPLIRRRVMEEVVDDLDLTPNSPMLAHVAKPATSRRDAPPVVAAPHAQEADAQSDESSGLMWAAIITIAIGALAGAGYAFRESLMALFRG